MKKAAIAENVFCPQLRTMFPNRYSGCQDNMFSLRKNVSDNKLVKLVERS